MTKFSHALVYLIVFGLFCLGGGLFINNAIDRPVAADTGTYTADFTSAAGLKVGNDVRILGARVGKVTDMSVHHDTQSGSSVARVRFQLDTSQRLYQNSKLAIRYLNLTGIRYIDIQQDAHPDAPVPGADTVIPAQATIPSFDVTKVFHGLAPVFATMNTNDINHFAESLLALLEGDGSGFSDFVSSLTTVVRFADDRDKIINTLVDNLAGLSGSVQGRSQYITPIIDYVSRFGTVLAQWTPQLRGLADNTGNLLIQADYLLAALGLQPNRTPDAEFFVGQLKPLGQAALNLLALSPAVLNAINSVIPPAGAQQTTLTCSRGRAALPTDVALFIRESQVTLCKR
ncbi:MlaD family protein [Gordonia sp. VNQ95]|jgi:phospholipid/cholesterol/gamma-HCH transport system substrate-binding protein|uniref:MlaD family protein n=1 Tax=Gordonia sp. VNQ95 TaxID=3156619 RepID=UPI0032B3E0C9